MDHAECNICGCGQLLPFTSPNGYTVYFCTNCRARFSGYQEEPFYEGSPIFSEMAYYSFRDPGDNGQTFTEGGILDQYRALLEEYPPQLSVENMPITEKCSEVLLSDLGLPDASWLPEI
ncbi:MAG: hypothetical protein U9R75_12870 [Candidatus Thermoplasmatota archaeon]|nr:hypothetical protein [Candidatus Thermoplasmatota archaeon]